MVTGTGSSLTSAVVLLLVFGFIFGRRLLASVRGQRIRIGWLIAYPVLVVGLFGLTVSAGALALPLYTFAIYAAVLVACYFVGEAYIRQSVEVVETSPGVWIFRAGILLPAIYLGLFLARALLDLLVLNYNPFGGSLAPPVLSSGTLVILLVVDLLYAASTGLIVGRTVAVYRIYRAKRAKAGEAPLPSGAG
ncbi:MAG: hypothetical protein AAFA34_01350 [Thermoplasmata archaeon]|jgi:hypothetical protein